MRKLIKKSDMSYTSITHEIADKCKEKSEFFFSQNCDHRFAVPRRTIWTEESGMNLIIFKALGASMVKVIDFDRALVGYKDTTGVYNLNECYLTKDLIGACKQAKKMKSDYVIDLRNSKLISSNG